ncbi:MAG: hypothetical protein ACREXI_06640, partial [Caldimonas sp.]
AAAGTARIERFGPQAACTLGFRIASAAHAQAAPLSLHFESSRHISIRPDAVTVASSMEECE